MFLFLNISKSLTSTLNFFNLCFSVCDINVGHLRIQYSSSHSYSGVCWLLASTFDPLFSTSKQLYFLLSPSLPNPILWIFVGVWARDNTLGTDKCVICLSPLESPFFSSCSPLSPSSLSYLHVTLWTSLVVPHGGKSFHH